MFTLRTVHGLLLPLLLLAGNLQAQGVSDAGALRQQIEQGQRLQLPRAEWALRQ